MTHPLREYLKRQIAADPGSDDQDDPNYSPAQFVRKRLLEFPFERYPDYCYPGRLIRYEHIRWDHVEQTLRFCDRLPQPKGSRAGQPVRLLGFQVMIIYCILGPEDPETRLRLARTVVMTIARKNGKTSLVGMMLLAMMSLQCFDMRAQDVQVGASDREQAGKTFDILQNLILMDRAMGLADFFHIVPSRKKIVHKRTFSNLECLSSDVHRSHGGNPAAVLLDELGNLPDGKAREFFSVLSTAFGSQLEPLLLMFSTQAPNDSHIFSEFVDRAKTTNVSGETEEGLLGFLFDLPMTDDGTGLVCIEEKGKKTDQVDHFAEANWLRPNPALEGLEKGGFRSLDDLRRKAREASKMPSLENSFRNLQLNQRITSYSPFISQRAWMACLSPPADSDFLEACPCYIALDLSARRDLTAAAYVWLLGERQLYARVKFYTPAEGIEEKSKADRVPLSTWAREGHVVACPGKMVDFAIVAEDLRQATEEYLIEKIGFDRWRIMDLMREVAAVGLEVYDDPDDPFYRPVGQGFKDQGPCLEKLEEVIVEQRLKIENNPCMTWNAANAVTVSDPAGNRKFEKSKSYGRIDGMVALGMAVWLASQADMDERSGENTGMYEAGGELLVL